MAKKNETSKKKHSKLAKAATRREKWKKRGPTLIILLIIIITAFYFAYGDKLFPTKKDEGGVKGYTAISFQKQGELSFTNEAGEFISKIDIELAEDDAKRANGMMYRSKMDDAQGMFFIFPSEAPQSFWMMNTVISLDIIFVNAKYEIVNIHKNTKPFSQQSYTSNGHAQYVVEVNAGYCEKHGIKTGDKIVWRRL